MVPDSRLAQHPAYASAKGCKRAEPASVKVFHPFMAGVLTHRIAILPVPDKGATRAAQSACPVPSHRP